MDTFGIITGTFSACALVFGTRNHQRINTLEKALKEFDTISGRSDPDVTPAKPERSA